MTEKKPVEWISYQGKSEFKKDKKIVLVSGDEEYRSEEALPQLAKILSSHHGFDCTVLFAQNPEKPGIIDPNFTKNIPGLEELETADLLILFTRFRELSDSQMQIFQDYLLAGKPLIGIRTATHAFNFTDSLHNWVHWGNYYKNEGSGWEGGFGRKILGANWYYHHGHHKHQSTRGIVAEGADTHPVLKGISSGMIWGPTDVYGMPLPLPGDAQPLLLGQVINRAGAFDETDLFYGMKPTDQEIATLNPASKKGYDPNDPMMPIVWLKSYQLNEGKAGKALTSTIGASADMMNESLRRLFVNATYFLLGLDVPENAAAGLVGKFKPTPYSFHDDAYWEEQQLKVSDYLD